MRLLLDRRFQSTVIFPTWRPYEHNLNRIRKDFLDQSYDFWLNIDADNPPVRSVNPLDLINFDLDFVGFPTPVWHSAVKGDRPWYMNVMREVEGGWQPWQELGPCEGLQEVDATGSGCFLASRRVMEGTPPFARTYDEDGILDKGHDFEFCRIAREKGFRIYTHWGYPCHHFNELCVDEVIESFAAVEAVNG